MSLASSHRAIWIYAMWRNTPYHIQYTDREHTECGFYNMKKPLKYAVEAYAEHTQGRCGDCIFWFQFRLLENMTRKESQ